MGFGFESEELLQRWLRGRGDARIVDQPVLASRRSRRVGRKPPPPKEFQECIQLNDFRNDVLNLEPRLLWLFHIPNGEERPAKLVKNRQTGEMVRISPVAQKLKAMGVIKGIADFCLPVPVPPFHGLWLEMKRHGRTPTQAWADCTPEEQAFLTAMAAQGYATAVASGWVEGAQALCTYLGRLDLIPV